MDLRLKMTFKIMDYLATLAPLSKIEKILNCLSWLSKRNWLNCLTDQMHDVEERIGLLHIFVWEGNPGQLCRLLL